MIAAVNHIDNVPAPLRIAGGGFVRSDGEHPGTSHEEFSTLDQERKGSGAHRQGPPEGAALKGRGARGPDWGAATETAVRPPPADPGLVMARQLAGDGKTDESLGRLLDDLDDINSLPPGDEGPQQSIPPVAPFAHSNRFGGPFHRAASAYQWGLQALNSEDPLRPGVIYSEQF